MKRTAFQEASWPRQFIAFTLDAALAYGAVYGVFVMLFANKPDILSTRDFTVVMALNAVFFSLPSMAFGATPGALATQSRFMKDGNKPRSWILMLRGLYFFPLGVIVCALHLPLKLLMNDQAPFDPIFGLQLMKRVPAPLAAAPVGKPATAQDATPPSSHMIFGTRTGTIDTARRDLERALSIRFTERDSSFWGDYFSATGFGDTKMMLVPNAQDKKDAPLADASYALVLHVEASGSRAALLRDLIEACGFESIR